MLKTTLKVALHCLLNVLILFLIVSGLPHTQGNSRNSKVIENLREF